MRFLCFKYHVQDTSKYLIENYSKTHHGDKTTSEVSMIEHTQYRVLQRIRMRKINSIYHSCTEAFKWGRPGNQSSLNWKKRFNLHQVTELTGQMNGRTGSWEVAMLTESVPRRRVSKPAVSEGRHFEIHLSPDSGWCVSKNKLDYTTHFYGTESFKPYTAWKVRWKHTQRSSTVPLWTGN